MSLLTDRDKCAHLLRRFGLGSSENELEYYSKDGLHGAIELLLNYDSVDEGFSLPIDAFKAPPLNRLTMPSLLTWWSLRLLMTRRPLQEKMTLFWHAHFATSASKVNSPYVMISQNEVLRRNATGNFRHMLAEVSKDPAMILWLDGQQNFKGHANENFAREVMELFTLGIGHYSEKDIQEGARAFTGWAIKRTKLPEGKSYTAEFIERPRLHDEGEKTFFGNKGNFNGDDILNIICDQHRVAEYITWKMWSWFAYPNPEPHVVATVADKFRSSGLEIKALLRAIMTSPEFYSAKAERAVVKCPVDVCVSTLRQLGVGEMVGQVVRTADMSALPRGQLAPAAVCSQAMKSMGMWLFYPPDVSGWKTGQAWISSATMVARMGWSDQMFGQGTSTRAKMRFPAYQIFANDPTPAGVVKTLLTAFDVPLKPNKVKLLLDTATKASSGSVTPENANETAAAVCRLMFATPEFQLS